MAGGVVRTVVELVDAISVVVVHFTEPVAVILVHCTHGGIAG